MSPVVTANGLVVVATMGGPIYAFDTRDGALLGQCLLKESPNDPDYYHTFNTPCVRGNRVYLSTERTDDPDFTGRLWAVDVDPSRPGDPFHVVWSFVFGGPSGSSPLAIEETIFFDGDRRLPGEAKNPHIFAVEDQGGRGALKWTVPMAASMKASFARDPRGGLWAFAAGDKWLGRYDQETGERIDRLDVDALLGEAGLYFTSSVMTIAGDAGRPVMILGAVTSSFTDPSWVLAIDLEGARRLWKVRLAEHRSVDFTASQFAIVLDPEGGPVVIFPGLNRGAYGVGVPGTFTGCFTNTAARLP